MRRRSDAGAPRSPDGRMLEGIIHLGALLTSTLGLAEAAQQIVEYACILTGLPAFALFVRRGDTPGFELCALEGGPQELAQLHLRPIDVAALDFERRGASSLPSAELHPPDLASLLQDHGFPLVFAAPIVVEGVRLTGLLLGLDRRSTEPDAELLRGLRLLAMQAASALWNAERYEAELAARAELDKELARTRMLQEVATAGTVSSRLEDVADGLLATLRAHFDAGAGHVRLRDEERGGMELLSAYGYPRPLLDRLRESRRPLQSPVDPDFPNLTLAVMPIESRGDVRGELCLAFSRELAVEDEESLLLQTVSHIAGQALENLRAFRTEHRIAETLQQALSFLPPAVEGLAYDHAYRSATRAASVGGDFYDLFELGGGRVGLVIGDVSGKGVGAASLTLVLRSAIRAYTYEGGPPSDTLRKTSQMMERLSDLSTFATLFFGVLDLDSGNLMYCAGGHPPALLRRPGGEVRELLVRSPLLGALADLEFVDDSVRLERGDVLLLYTDGILEARGREGLFGEERLRAALAGGSRIPGVAAHVLRAVTRYTGGGLTDDAAVLAVGLEGRRTT